MNLKTKSILQGAAILAIPAILLTIATIQFDSLKNYIGFINIALFVLFPFYWGKKYKKSLPGHEFFNFGKAFKYSFSIIAIAMVLAQIPAAIKIATSDTQVLVEKSIAAMHEQGQEVTQEYIDLMMNTMSNKGGMIGFSYFIILLSAILYSLIVSIFIKKNINEIVVEDEIAPNNVEEVVESEIAENNESKDADTK